jgi:DNA-binding transcriptional MerR regulator
VQAGLTLGQICRVAGVTRARLHCWTARAEIPTAGKTQRLYGMDALELVMLIKRGKQKGLSLEQAVQTAKASRWRRERAGPELRS